jgi:nifR3 family TIM-barrel protein
MMARAAAIIEKLGRFDLIDINCGCPVRKIVAKGSGVALMSDPGRIGEIVAAVRRAVDLPVTVKTRLGPDPDRPTLSAVAEAVESAGGNAVFIHARFASNRHSGPADWNVLARIKSERGIPVIGNGGIDTASDVPAMLEQTGVDGVMIGRAAVGNPWIFDEIRCLFSGKPHTPHSHEEHRQIIARHLHGLVALKTMERRYRRRRSLPPDQAAALHFRSHLVRYMSRMHGWRELTRNLQRVNTAEAVMEAVDKVLSAQRTTLRSRHPTPDT